MHMCRFWKKLKQNKVLQKGKEEMRSQSPIHTAAEGWIKEDTGIGIRFPRFTGRVRDDKGPEMSTSVQEIYEMYEMQSSDS